MQEFKFVLTLVTVASVFGCTGFASQGVGDGPGQPALLQHSQAEVPRDLPKSRTGNPPTYEVFGQQYHVMDSAKGYREIGQASWYGAKFHGRKTSSGETYDMYNMTAAHRSLPLPTFVRVINLENNQEIVVKVNDRGPFHDNRIIDLSYAAASELGVLEKGTAEVEVIAISSHEKHPSVAEAAPTTFGDTGTPSQIIQVEFTVSGQDERLFRVRFNVAAKVPLPDLFAHLEGSGIENYQVIEP